MFYTMQELAAQIKAWEYYVAILFLLLLIGFWQMLRRESKRRRLSQAAQGVPQAREDCTDYARGPLPCWLSRQLVSGKTMEECAGCPVYTQGIARLTRSGQNGMVANALSKPPAAAEQKPHN